MISTSLQIGTLIYVLLVCCQATVGNALEASNQLEQFLVEANADLPSETPNKHVGAAPQIGSSERLRQELLREVELMLVEPPMAVKTDERVLRQTRLVPQVPRSHQAGVTESAPAPRASKSSLGSLLVGLRRPSWPKVNRKRIYNQLVGPEQQSDLWQNAANFQPTATPGGSGDLMFSGQKTIRNVQPVNMRMPPRFGKRTWVIPVAG